MESGIRGKWKYDIETGGLVPIGAISNINSPAPAIHQDTMEPLMHPATGQIFDSKSAFRNVTKSKGYVEIDDNATWDKIGESREVKLSGFKDDFEEVKHWYKEALRGNRDYINANVPPEFRDCEEVDPNNIMG